jgi:hypothetical protein
MRRKADQIRCGAVVLGKRTRQESNIPNLKPELQLEQNQRQYNSDRWFGLGVVVYIVDVVLLVSSRRDPPVFAGIFHWSSTRNAVSCRCVYLLCGYATMRLCGYVAMLRCD